MRSFRRLGLGLLVASAFVSISVATASAEEFVYSKTGKLAGRAVTNQEFKMGNATLDCNEAAASGEVTSLKFKELAPLSVKYSGCIVSGVGRATVSAAKYTYMIAPSLFSEPAITVNVSVLGVKCSFVIGADQSLGGKAGELEYENKGGKIVIKSQVTDVAYEVTESNYKPLCGSAGEKGTTGTFNGEDEVEIEGGVIEVK